MMDYKELIRRLDDCGEFDGDLLDAAAEAIETLLAERNALMKDAVRCETCLHVKECSFNKLRVEDCAQSNRGHWKWRGPKKEDIGNEQN